MPVGKATLLTLISILSSCMCVYLWIFPNFNVYLQAGGKAGKDSGKSKAKAVSRSARAGLQVNNIRIFLTNKKKNMKKNVSLCVIGAHFGALSTRPNL